MNRLKTYSLYVKNAMWFMFLRFKGNRIDAPVRQLIGKWSTIEVNKRGKLSLGNKLFTRTGFHVLVDSGICEIGNNCFFNHNCSITCLEKISIGNRCTFGNNVVIGSDSIILYGKTIGNNVIVAAGSVVTKDIPANCVAVGNPCRVIRKINEEC